MLPGNTVVGTGADLVATQSGTYTLYEDNGTCNSTSAPVTLTIIQTPVADAGPDIYIKEGTVGSLNGSGGAVYSWSPATYLSDATISNPSFTATQTITYTLTVSDATSTCSTTDDVTVIVVSPVKVPNVITVNGDGANDDWELENIEGYPNVIIEIYNRWGNLVWKTEGYPKNWDGTNFRNGEVLADGTYFYIINLKSQLYDEPLTGWVQIMK
jgi:gliding motility-associated-like protein